MQIYSSTSQHAARLQETFSAAIPPPEVARPEEQWVLSGAQRGRAIHDLIGGLLETTRTPSHDRIATQVAEHDLMAGQPIIHRQAIKQRLVTAISCYFARYAPCELWDFVGSSVRLGNCEFDLLWRDSRDGRILADELKTGLLGLGIGRTTLDAQVARQLQNGIEAFGPKFAGVRAIVLGDPSQSYLTHPDGTREPLIWEVM